MAEKPAKKVDRYKDSPTLKRDESDGKMKVTKKPSPTPAEKASGEDAAGTAGMPIHEVHAKHEKERFDLYQRQQKEFADMHQRHLVETGGANPLSTDTEASKE